MGKRVRISSSASCSRCAHSFSSMKDGLCEREQGRPREWMPSRCPRGWCRWGRFHRFLGERDGWRGRRCQSCGCGHWLFLQIIDLRLLSFDSAAVLRSCGSWFGDRSWWPPKSRLPKFPNLYVHAGNRAITRVQGGYPGMPKAWRPTIHRDCLQCRALSQDKHQDKRDMIWFHLIWFHLIW